MAIGSRSQSARTYLEKHLNEFLSCDLDELVKHGLRALRDTLPNEVDLSIKVSRFDEFKSNDVWLGEFIKLKKRECVKQTC